VTTGSLFAGGACERVIAMDKNCANKLLWKRVEVVALIKRGEIPQIGRYLGVKVLPTCREIFIYFLFLLFDEGIPNALGGPRTAHTRTDWVIIDRHWHRHHLTVFPCALPGSPGAF